MISGGALAVSLSPKQPKQHPSMLKRPPLTGAKGVSRYNLRFWISIPGEISCEFVTIE